MLLISISMADKNLLQRLGIQINPKCETKVDEMTNQEAVQEAINSTSRGRIRDYFSMGLGVALFADGFADLGADILERVASVVTTRDFNLYSAIELGIGVGLAYLGVRARNKKEASLKSLANSLNEHYVQE